ncbi:MAG: hypothetical protein VYA34_05795 [Myxococcota bacterium]|nr:hypothetical protein [Myxococcota bacterium]
MTDELQNNEPQKETLVVSEFSIIQKSASHKDIASPKAENIGSNISACRETLSELGYRDASKALSGSEILRTHPSKVLEIAYQAYRVAYDCPGMLMPEIPLIEDRIGLITQQHKGEVAPVLLFGDLALEAIILTLHGYPTTLVATEPYGHGFAQKFAELFPPKRLQIIEIGDKQVNQTIHDSRPSIIWCELWANPYLFGTVLRPILDLATPENKIWVSRPITLTHQIMAICSSMGWTIAEQHKDIRTVLKENRYRDDWLRLEPIDKERPRKRNNPTAPQKEICLPRKFQSEPFLLLTAAVSPNNLCRSPSKQLEDFKLSIESLGYFQKPTEIYIDSTQLYFKLEMAPGCLRVGFSAARNRISITGSTPENPLARQLFMHLVQALHCDIHNVFSSHTQNSLELHIS